MANGTVDFFQDRGGDGFIETDGADDDVFFHMEDVGGGDLTEGTEIDFDIEQAPTGPRAMKRRSHVTRFTPSQRATLCTRFSNHLRWRAVAIRVEVARGAYFPSLIT
jgi:CspA family cold shock protein